ncbi:MAG: M20/M25/M40 family metallo-hydrolase [Sphingobacteriaceae bacterium]|nr:M20/M25/M40 family metallo-hydrolase [Sphingobacteriaceae bacterium]
MKTILLITLTAFIGLTTLQAQNPMVQSILNDVRIDSLTKFVAQLSGETPVIINGQPDTIKTRYSFSSGNEKAFQFMKAIFVQYGFVVDSMVFSANGKNLFGIKTGYKYPNRKFILGAHYDNMPNTPIAPGADDNASGTAAVLEAARIFSNYNFPHTLVFALWDEEEQGLLGSTAYVPTIGSNNDTLMGYINMDMLGWDGNNDTIADLNVRPVANSLQLADKAIKCDSVYNIQLKLHIVNPGNGSTDHAPFWNNGFTAIGIDEEYDNDFNPYWHTIADSLGQFNLDFYERCAKLAYATLADCAADTVNVVSIEHHVQKFTRIIIYPNPFSSETTLQTEIPFKNANLTLNNCFGQTIKEINNISGNTVTISRDNLPSGLYFIRLTQDNKIITVDKLVITD